MRWAGLDGRYAACPGPDSGAATIARSRRLAPAQPFPAGLDDVLSVYKGLLQVRVFCWGLIWGSGCGLASA